MLLTDGSELDLAAGYGALWVVVVLLATSSSGRGLRTALPDTLWIVTAETRRRKPECWR
jgi:hypothetical protein